MSSLGSPERPLRVAIVGSGPSGFYAAEALFKSSITVHVDIFDRLPTPFGLVRGGVAPDHDKIKNVTKVYEKIMSHEHCSFWGNVCIGKDLSVDELKQYYDASIYANGAETDKRLGIPGEDLPGSHTATEFVGWYNGHPDYHQCRFDLSHEAVVVIGQGNVAMDVCRILAKTVDELKNTDIAQHALDVLAESKVKEIHMMGRRGPAQTAFTPKEIEEFGHLADCDPVFDPGENLSINPSSQVELDDPKNMTARQNVKILQEFFNRGAPSKNKKFVIHFLKSPFEILGKDRVERVLLSINTLSGEPFQQKATATDQRVEIPCGLFFRSVGYRGVPISGLPFHEKWGIFPNKDGRILAGDSAIPGLYAAGWIKRGPSGVIGTNKPDSVATVTELLKDVPQLPPCPIPDSTALKTLLKERKVHVVDFKGWKTIDAQEIAQGQAKGKPREKFTTIPQMLSLVLGDVD